MKQLRYKGQYRGVQNDKIQSDSIVIKDNDGYTYSKMKIVDTGLDNIWDIPGYGLIDTRNLLHKSIKTVSKILVSLNIQDTEEV